MELLAGGALISKMFRLGEGFEDKQKSTTTEPQSAVTTYGGIGLLVVIGILFIFFLQSCAGARLSWCYNKSIGTNTLLAVIYAILCFFFPGFYMILYAFFLAPPCGGEVPKTNIVESVATNITNTLKGQPNFKVGGGKR